MTGSASAALDWITISAVLLRTSFGRVWRWHLLIAAFLVVACAVRRVRPAYRAVLGGLLLASLGWVGHATIGEGRIGLAHEINQSAHLLAGGVQNHFRISVFQVAEILPGESLQNHEHCALRACGSGSSARSSPARARGSCFATRPAFAPPKTRAMTHSAADSVARGGTIRSIRDGSSFEGDGP